MRAEGLPEPVLTRGNDGQRWYRVRFQIEDSEISGWVRYDLVTEITECPSLTE